ncbi:MAG: hypothetical protein ACRD0G_01555, partial [Acidimicrobiales bacterium]
MTEATSPPQPEFADLVGRSAWIQGRPGLTAEILQLDEAMAPARASIEDTAAALATPRLDAATMKAIARTLVRFVWYALL